MITFITLAFDRVHNARLPIWPWHDLARHLRRLHRICFAWCCGASELSLPLAWVPAGRSSIISREKRGVCFGKVAFRLEAANNMGNRNCTMMDVIGPSMRKHPETVSNCIRNPDCHWQWSTITLSSGKASEGRCHIPQVLMRAWMMMTLIARREPSIESAPACRSSLLGTGMNKCVTHVV